MELARLEAPPPKAFGDIRSAPTGARHIGLSHVAFFRGWLEGLDLAALGERYLETGKDRRQATATLRWLREEMVNSARRRRPEFTRLLRLQPGWESVLLAPKASAKPAEEPPSLEEYQASEDPQGYYTERELIERYAARYDTGGDEKAARRAAARSEDFRRRVREAIAWIEGDVATQPRLDDNVAGWFRPPVAANLEAAGVTTIGDLLALMKKRGGTWHKRVGKLGREGAKRLAAWCERERLLSSVQLPVVAAPRAPIAPSFGIVPHDRLAVPAALDGATGINRGDAPLLGASNDAAAIARWLETRKHQPLTLRSYRGHVERFLLFMLHERGKPLSAASVEDCGAYRSWLDELGRRPEDAWAERWRVPQADWLQKQPDAGEEDGDPDAATKRKPRRKKKAGPAPRDSDDWRPFASPPAPGTRDLALVVLNALFTWLRDQRYLLANPWEALAKPKKILDIRVDHALTVKQWRHILATSEALEAERRVRFEAAHPGERYVTSETYLRLRFVLTAAYHTGMRLFELAAMKIAGEEHTKGDGRDLGLRPAEDGDGWDLYIQGKRDKRRTRPVADVVIDTLADYMEARGLGRDPHAWPDQMPLIATLSYGEGQHVVKTSGAALSTKALARVFKSHFAATAARMDNDRDRRRLAAASTHWMRHTHVTHALESGTPVQEAQKDAGHSTPAITSLYSHESRERRKANAERLARYAAGESGER